MCVWLENRKTTTTTTFEAPHLWDTHIKWLIGFLSLVKTHKIFKDPEAGTRLASASVLGLQGLF